ncbi:MAG: type II toxin-antitoxin system death-on-curing family toxin [Rhodospirillales bacterium]
MREPNWLLLEAVIAVHKMLVAEHGGIAEIRDRGLLESALARPQNRFAYEPGANLFDLAASYAYGLARNHAFVDGNKRISITAVAMFLGDNGREFAPEKMDALETFLRLAAGEVEEADLARWIERNSRKKKRGRRS